MSQLPEGNLQDLAQYKLAQAKDDLETANILLNAGKYKAANNRAYYCCFHSIGAILALEPIAFKRHKDTLSYFNKNYVRTEYFPKDMGRKISRLEIIRHKSDYDTFYIASKEETIQQIRTAQELTALTEDFLSKKGSP
ncbi:MAG TPA: DNA-binding protein [Lachnospiraceae bacterium]|nr:DNA-binding protein [Lachnospiraceae bacterium]